MTYLRHERVGKRMMSYKELPVFVKKQAADKDARNSLVVTQLDDLRLNRQPSNVVLLFVHATQHYVNNPNKVPAFKSPFYTKQGCSCLLNPGRSTTPWKRGPFLRSGPLWKQR